MKSKLKNRIIYLVIIFCVIVAITVYFFHTLSDDRKNALKQEKIDGTYFSDKPFAEYEKDLKLSKSMEFKGAIYSKTRSPIEQFIYRNTYVFLYSLPIKSNKHLSEILRIKHVGFSVTSPTTYYELTDPYNFKEHSIYSIIYKSGTPKPGSEIDFYLSGSTIKISKKSDTVYSCSAQIGNFSISYNNFDIADFYGEEKSGKKLELLPVNITFEEKNGHYYVFLMIQRK